MKCKPESIYHDSVDQFLLIAAKRSYSRLVRVVSSEFSVDFDNFPEIPTRRCPRKETRHYNRTRTNCGVLREIKLTKIKAFVAEQ